MNTRLILRTLRMAVAAAALVSISMLGSAPIAAAQQASGGAGPLTDLQPDTPSPTDSAAAELTVAESSGSTTLRLDVRGLVVAPGTAYGAHLHFGLCMAGDASAAGPRYDSSGQPALIAGSPTEVSLDFVVSVVGDASAQTTVPFVIPAGKANSVVISDSDGTPVACLPVTIAASVVTATADEVQGISQTADEPATLAFTGAESENLAVIGLALAGAGSAVLAVRRRLDGESGPETSRS